ncbi:winged helix-turn-helix domain-containing protein [Dysgonomonas sp. GY75]|uniref:winged helix-turn-helix domain-containing protein n=1 Tax=Dysgonomonas sp. GY75 TaxID=2780419 RepID=UPI001F55619E|nr:winged helix-turn-helix domain-containing protein [Dysgonomonas sp. GY75]
MYNSSNINHHMYYFSILPTISTVYCITFICAMLKEAISIDAKYIQELLSSGRGLAIEELVEITGYRNDYICLVLGWLSKEDIISYWETDDGLVIKLNDKT